MLFRASQQSSALLICFASVRNYGAFAANVFDWTPSISLSDNFGVSEGLCPDIAGFGSSLNCDAIMQLHTCKAWGDDTQFVFDLDSNVIRSVNYDANCQSITGGNNDACITIDGSISDGDNLRLSTCNNGIKQKFELSADRKIKAVADSELCLAKTSDVGPAGPNERTNFALANCDAADPLDVTWTVASPISPALDVTEAPVTEAPTISSTSIDTTNTTKSPTFSALVEPSSELFTDSPGSNETMASEIDQSIDFEDDLIESENFTRSVDYDFGNTEDVTEDTIENTVTLVSSKSSPLETAGSFTAISSIGIFVALGLY